MCGRVRGDSGMQVGGNRRARLAKDHLECRSCPLVPLSAANDTPGHFNRQISSRAICTENVFIRGEKRNW